MVILASLPLQEPRDSISYGGWRQGGGEENQSLYKTVDYYLIYNRKYEMADGKFNKENKKSTKQPTNNRKRKPDATASNI